MKRTVPAYAALFLSLGGAVLAQEAGDMDTDGDGMVSYPEALEAYPDLTEDGFTVVDTSGDGLWDAAEVAAAVEAGLLTPMEG